MSKYCEGLKGGDGIYYLHQNGSLIYKPQSYVLSNPDFADGDLVKRVWPVDLAERGHCWVICIEALAYGADRERVFELAKKWGCTDDDAQIFVERAGLRFSLDGDTFCATFEDFIDLQQSQAGFGDTALEALAELAKRGLSDD